MTEPGCPQGAAVLHLRNLRALVYRCPIDTPVRTAFGVMTDRPAVFVRAEDAEGVVGWGEIWCNFPGCGAEHRARLLDTVVAPRLVGRTLAHPSEAFHALTPDTAVLAIQSGEHGPLAQVIAGMDIALWDLYARRAGVPLWKLLGGRSGRVRVYASGLNPDSPERLALSQQQRGHVAFKLKVGFGAERDSANLAALRDTLGPQAALMADANQAWTPQDTLDMLPTLEAYALGWLEEPLRADRPWHEWATIAQATTIPLAAGENLSSADAFEAALGAGVVSVVQPDIAKWGGYTGCLPVAQRTLARGRRYCPHYLGGGIGLLASAHLLAAVGGDGLLEIDANANPLRSLTCARLEQVEEGQATLDDSPGLGPPPDLDALAPFAVALR